MATTLLFNTISALTTYGAGSAGDLAAVLGYSNEGDGGGGDFYWDATSTEADDGGLIFSVGGTGRWKRIFKTDEVDVRWFGILPNGITDEASALIALLNRDYVNELVFDQGDYIITSGSDDVTVPAGKKLIFRNGSRIVGDGTLDGGIIDCDYLKQCFDVDLTVQNLLNSIISVCWFGAVADTRADGTGGAQTDNQPMFQNALNAMKSLFIPAYYDMFTKIKKRLFIPGALNAGYAYYLNDQWQVDTTCEVFGDGYLQSILVFQNKLAKAAIWLSYPSDPNYGGQDLYLHDFAVFGNWYASGYGGGDYYDHLSHGVLVETNNVKCSHMQVAYFVGDNWYVHADVYASPVSNGNNCVFDFIKGNLGSGSGFKLQGGDANNCRISNSDFHDNSRWGVNDISFLGNLFMGNHCAANGFENTWQRCTVYNEGLHLGKALYVCIKSIAVKCSNGGNRYHCILDYDRKLVGDSVAEPGVGSSWSTYWSLEGAGGPDPEYLDYQDNDFNFFQTTYYQPDGSTSGWENYWKYIQSWPDGAGGFYPQWVTSQWYSEGGAYLAGGLNQRGAFVDCYNESDQKVTNRGFSLFLGGFASYDGAFNGAIGLWNNAINSIAFQARDAEHNSGWKMDSGSGFTETMYNPGASFFAAIDGSDKYGLHYNRIDKRFTWNTNGADTLFDIVTSDNSTGYNSSIGRTNIPDNGYLSFTNGVWLQVFGSGIGADQRRLLGFARAVPSGEHAVGDMYLHNGDVSTIAYTCTVHGTPGTWITKYATITGDTTGRPGSLGSGDAGMPYFDTDLGIPIWWDGSNWIDATGTTV